jgi:hypothetical protein
MADHVGRSVEARALAADRCPDQLRLGAGRQAKQLVPARMDKIPVAVQMPQRAIGKDEAGGEALGFGGFEHLGQVIGGRHGYSSAFSTVMPRPRLPPR